MRATIAVASLLLFLGTAAATAHAEDGAGGNTITVDGNVAIPVGDLSDAAGLGIGASGTFHFAINDQLGATGRAGLIYHLPKEVGPADITFLIIPLLGGVNYSLKPGGEGVYFGAELGLYYANATVDVMGTSESDSETNLGTALTAGFRTGALDFRGGLQFYDIGEAGDSMSLLLTASYQVAAL